MANLLEQLNKVTVTVADTGDIHSIEKFRPRDATTNPSLITAAAQMKEYADIVDGGLRWAEREAGPNATEDKVVKLALDRLAVEFGLRIGVRGGGCSGNSYFMEFCPGPEEGDQSFDSHGVRPAASARSSRQTPDTQSVIYLIVPNH